MSLPLHREVAPPRSPARIAAYALSAGMLAGATCFAALVGPHHEPASIYVTLPPAPALPAAPTLTPTPTPTPALTPTPAPTPAPTPTRANFALTFQLGTTTYLSLAELPNVKDPHADKPEARTSVPKHGALRLAGNRDYPDAALATIEPADLPPALRAWHGRDVVVGGTCLARVAGFDLVSRSSGGWEFHYADADMKKKTDAELARKLFTVGQAVIAARLDGCTGSYARDAAAPAILRGVAVDAYEAAALAKKRLIASPEGLEAGRKWLAAGNKTDWAKQAEIKQAAVRHPKTGKIYVSVHAVLDEGCGGADINLWRLYELGAKGKLVLVRKSQPVGVSSIDEFVDIDGDGQFEFIVHDAPVGQDVVVLSHDGSERMRLSTPFYGCPC